MSRVENIRAAINLLDAVRYETGNDHPGYERVNELIEELCALQRLFEDAS